MMGDSYIAGWKKCSDWKNFRIRLLDYSNREIWDNAFRDYFIERLKTRYFGPVRILQENGTYQGEGFSIVTIHCSIIEFIETTYQGVIYRYLRRGETLNPFEYNNSCDIFLSFLTNRRPFSSYFNRAIAEDFYKNVRCGLLHEARTKDSWIIHAKSESYIILITSNEKIIYRDNFHKALEDYLNYYKDELLSSDKRKEAFIRKFDSLCS
jgi:hypothetical protein